MYTVEKGGEQEKERERDQLSVKTVQNGSKTLKKCKDKEAMSH